MPLQFIVDDEKNGAFVPEDTRAWKNAEEKLDSVFEAWRNGDITVGKAQKSIDPIMSKFPDMLSAHQIKAAILIDLAQEEVEGIKGDMSEKEICAATALSACWEGLSLAYSLMPKRFRGEISWYNLDNRPFLQLHHNKILALLELKQFESATKEMERHLRWNKSDNIGIRHLLGHAYLLANNRKKARQQMFKEAVHYPLYQYSIALMDFQDGNYVEAALWLRHAFLENTYIAENLIFGDDSPEYHALFEGGPFERHDMVEEYRAAGMIDLWKKDPEALFFMGWLYRTSLVAQDRLELAKKNEFFTYCDDLHERITAGDVFKLYKASISLETTSPVIRKVRERRGTEVWPWLWEFDDYVRLKGTVF